jgi:hypothetical protein
MVMTTHLVFLLLAVVLWAVAAALVAFVDTIAPLGRETVALFLAGAASYGAASLP